MSTGQTVQEAEHQPLVSSHEEVLSVLQPVLREIEAVRALHVATSPKFWSLGELWPNGPVVLQIGQAVLVWSSEGLGVPCVTTMLLYE